MFWLKKTSGFQYPHSKCPYCGYEYDLPEYKTYKGPFDFYGLPIGYELEWFRGCIPFCPHCGFTHDPIPFCANTRVEEPEKLAEILTENIPEEEIILKAATHNRSIGKDILYLYYEFTKQYDKSNNIRIDLLSQYDGKVAELNSLFDGKIIFVQDMAVTEVELYRRSGNFEQALKLCDVYSNMPSKGRTYDEPHPLIRGDKLISLEKRLCKNGNDMSAFAAVSRRLY